MTDSHSPKNVRISVAGNETCEALVAMGLFGSSLEAYRAAVGVALAFDLETATDVKLELNKWDTGSVFRDPDCNLEALLALQGIVGDDAVARGMQLAETGLRHLNGKRIANVDLVPILVGRPAHNE